MPDSWREMLTFDQKKKNSEFVTSDLEVLIANFNINDLMSSACGCIIRECKFLFAERGFTCLSPLVVAKVLSCKQQKPRS